jgi:CheY-like chemotaxis protein
MPSVDETPDGPDGPGGPEVRLLVVDDNAVNRLLLVRMLEVLGLVADTAVDGLDAERALARRAYTAVLLDVRMPGEDGPAVTRWLRAREAGAARRTPVIAVSAAQSAVDREVCRAAGMDAFVAKPVDLGDLRQVLTPYVSSGAASQPGPTATGDDVLDLGRLRDLEEQLGGVGLLRETVGVYLAELSHRREALRVAARADDRGSLASVAHTLRSSSAMLGATSLAQRCAELEEAGPDVTPSALGELAERADSLAAETGAALQRWLG